jgi:hypothetical protein
VAEKPAVWAYTPNTMVLLAFISLPLVGKASSQLATIWAIGREVPVSPRLKGPFRDYLNSMRFATIVSNDMAA